MRNTLVVNKKFYNSVNNNQNLSVLRSFGYNSADDFFIRICKKLNQEYDFVKLKGYRFLTSKEEKKYYMYSGFIEGDVTPYKQVVFTFTPISSKLGNTNIVQELMPMIANQMESNINFLIDKKIKKICILTSKFNSKNTISEEYNTLQMNVNSLNTINFDVIQILKVKRLSPETMFNSLEEYLEMAKFLQRKNPSNDQYEYFKLKNNVLYGNAMESQIKGQWQKTFVFKFLTAIFSGKNSYKYNIDGVMKHVKVDKQLENLERFIDHVNNSNIDFTIESEIPVDDVVESNDDVVNTDDIKRIPKRAIDKMGRQRFRTQRKIRELVLRKHNYLCLCHDLKHFYFESSDSFNNYVEGHHMIPMNRQTEYWEDKEINLDVESNIIPLCPTCHAQIHLGSRRAKLDILTEIYVRDKLRIKRVDNEIDLVKLASYYNIGLEEEEEKYLLIRAKIKVRKKEQGQM